VHVTWDPDKAQANKIKHGVSFEEAASALLDPFALDAPDLVDPMRTIVIGMSARSRLLFVVTLVFEREDIIRIISARKASPTQRRQYEKAP
jgi:uncharacterized DUF497 family protein